MPRIGFLLAASSAALATAAITGCGAGSETVTDREVTVTVVKEVRERPARKRIGRAATARAAAQPKFVMCDANISVRADTTTCEFAQNVFYEFWVNTGATRFDAYSPAVDATFATRCRTSVNRVVCTTSDDAVVRFPLSAVAAYTQSQADAYASQADLGPSGPDEVTGAAQDGGGTGCDPNYEGACLDASAYDYDCEGGSGDGPDYTGEVYVVGDDHFGLDSDGDGIACAW